MTPTLFGRIQTRLFLLATVGVVWTVIFAPFLPTQVAGANRLRDLYTIAFVALGLVALFGIAWEFLWHFLMQFRWEKDWPAMFILLQAIPEGLVVYFVLQNVVSVETQVGALAFWLIFGTTWLWVFVAAHGPMRVLTIRWRFRGGRLI